MDAFTPPTPALPQPAAPVPPLPAAERRVPPILTPVADVFSNNTTTPWPGTSKPLPPGPELQHTEEIEDRPILKKTHRALPKIPVSPSATKRRSMSVSDVDNKATPSTTPAADAVSSDRRPKDNAAGWEDSSLHGLLDVFKGELSTLDPASPASLDLRDPSTPLRQVSSRSQTNDFFLSARETEGGGDGERDEGVKSTPASAPATVSQWMEPADRAVPVAIIPPRSSSLQSPVYSFGSATSSRQANYTLTPLRKPGPSMVATASPNKHLRAVHRSIASSSEPSLIPTLDESRVCKQYSFLIILRLLNV